MGEETNKSKSVFETLSAIDVNKHTEKKDNLTYLSWAWAWGITKKTYPTADYEVNYFEGKPYLFDENLGYLVSTRVTIDGETIPMHLPVMNGANKAQKHVAYKYSTKYGDKTVEAATMFDINTAIMRCLTKNLAMFGLGHYIYAGEDLPEVEKPVAVKAKQPTTADIIVIINSCDSVSKLQDISEKLDISEKYSKEDKELLKKSVMDRLAQLETPPEKKDA